MSNYKTIIDEVVGSWISQGRAFTSYEVSKEVQSRLKEDNQPHVRHAEMRSYYSQCQPLVEEVSYGSYKATLIDVKAPEKPFLYHPDTYDPENYVPMPRNDKKPFQPPVVGQGGALAMGNQTSPNTPQSSNKTDVNVVNQGDELWIGSQHLLAIDLHPGDSFEMYKSGNQVLVVKEAPVGAPYLKKMTVEQKGNSRLSKQARDNFGFHSNKFKIVTENDCVIIEEA